MYICHVHICVHMMSRDLIIKIFLSLEKAMGKLETVLDGFESQEVVPSLFVFMGNFCSHPCNLSFHSFSSLR